MKKITLLFVAIVISLSMYAQTVQRIPLFEIFTSSTCPPCKPGNTNVKNILAGKPVNDYCIIKYQQNFPGSGDPYCTVETKNRRTTPYAINSVPRMEIDGLWDQNASNFTAALYTSARAATPLYDMNGQYHVDVATKKVTCVVNFKSLGTVVNPKLYVTINEKLTDNNIKTNGETVFEDVCKKFLPTETGSTITASTTFSSLSFSYTFPGNYVLPANGGGSTGNPISTTSHTVEEFTDLYVIAWVQGSDKKVYQSCRLTVSATPLNVEKSDISVNNITTYPNPASDNVTVSFTSQNQDKVSFLLTGVDGSISQSFEQNVSAGNNQIELNTSELASGTYFLSVMDSKSNAHTSPIVIVK